MYAVMRPKLEAERLLGLHEAVMMASNGVKPQDRQKWIRDLRRTAGLNSGRSKPRTLDDWAAQGMRVRRVSKPA